MRTIYNTPDLMTVIINIQAMRRAIDPKYDGMKDFKRLEHLTDEELHQMQDELIPEYNKAVNQLKTK